MRIEPPPSPAEAIGTRPAATAAAEPPLEPPGRALRVPGVAGDPVGRRLGEAADRQLRQQRQADDDRPRLAQPPHHLGVGLRRLVEAVGAVRVDLAGDVDFVLDRDRHSQQRPLLAGLQPRLGLLGLEQRPLGEDLAERVQLRVESLDPLQQSRTSSVGETSPDRTISAWRAAPAKATSSSTRRLSPVAAIGES